MLVDPLNPSRDETDLTIGCNGTLLVSKPKLDLSVVKVTESDI
jgi:hypothetical protein